MRKLDDIVHELHSEMASEINNRGEEAQREFIFTRLSLEEFDSILRQSKELKVGDTVKVVSSDWKDVATYEIKGVD